MVSMKLLLVAILVVVAAAGSPAATAQGTGSEFQGAAGGPEKEAGTSVPAAALGVGAGVNQGAGGVDAGLANGAVQPHA